MKTMERKDWVMLGGFAGTILTILVVFFTGLQTMNRRFEAVDKRFEAIDKRFEAIVNRFDAALKRLEDRLQVIEQKIFEMSNRISRIEGHLGITAAVPDGETPPAGLKGTNDDRNIP